MDLLLITGSFPERSETFIYRKSVGLAKRGHRVTIATRNFGDWSLYPDPLPPTLQVTRLAPDDSLRSPRRALRAAEAVLRRIVTSPGGSRSLYRKLVTHDRGNARRQFLRYMDFVDRKPDIVHFEFLSLAAMYPLAGLALPAAVVVSCRGQDLHTLELRPPAERENAVAWLKNAAAVHCVSGEMAREVTRLTGRTRGVWVNRPAVPVDQIAVRSVANESPRLLATGRLVWKKGFDYLLAALAKLVRRGIQFHLDILGDGELRSQLRFSIADLGLSNHVTLVGGVSSAEVIARLQKTDVFVLSSHEEGISNAVLEAMASGIPIVTTDAGGMREAVSDGEEGFVVTVRDVDALADAIAKLLVDPQLRERMGAAARRRVEREFSLERQLNVFEEIYRSASRS